MNTSIKKNIETHRVINIGDIFKDADAEPNIKDKRNLEKLIEEIVSNSTDPISYSKNKFEFQETKKFITNLMLPEVRRYSYSDLPSIPESSQSSGFNDPTKISKENRNILPINIKFFFIDAAMKSIDYKNKDLKDDKVIETFASYMDPATRSVPDETICYDLEFLKNDDSHIAYIDLSSYGFKKSCYVKLLGGSTTKYMYIEIGLNDLLLKCKIDRNGNISNDNSFVFTKNRISIYYYDFLKDIFFKGNPEKNKFINENINNSDDNIKYTSIMLLLLKELGDTMQAIILEKILENAKITDSKFGNYLGSSCLLTNDTVLATRCSMLSVPFLLKHNHILTSYQPPISEEDKKKVLKAYDKNQKLQEIERIILNNTSVINGLNELSNYLRYNQAIKKIKLSSKSEKIIELNNKYQFIVYINDLIQKIKNANTRLKEFSEIIYNDLKKVTVKLTGINQEQKKKYDENIINICKAEFYIFRTYIYQLNAIKLFKKIEFLNTNTLLTECLGSTTRTFLFKTKIPNKLHSDTFGIDDGFSLINDYENELFENGFIRKLEDKMSSTIGGGSNSKKNIIKSVSPQDIYLKVYPYIYCYPWFIEYMLDERNIVIIYRFLKELIYKDMVNKKLLDTIFSVKNEDYYFYLSLYNNIFNNDKRAILKLEDILIKLKKIIKNIPTNSLQLPRKTNKVTLRRTKSAPINIRFSKTRSKQKRKITTHGQTSKSPPKTKKLKTETKKSKTEKKKDSDKMEVEEKYEKPESPESPMIET
jgi:hypothetical protein